MKTEWILIANASTARLYGRTSPEQDLALVGEFGHPASRLRAGQLSSDRPGREAADHSSASTRFEPRTDPHRKELQHFAAALADRLEQGLASGEYDRLRLFVSNPFLGHLMEQLSPRVTQHVEMVHASDFTTLPREELEQRLRDPRLYRV